MGHLLQVPLHGGWGSTSSPSFARLCLWQVCLPVHGRSVEHRGSAEHTSCLCFVCLLLQAPCLLACVCDRRACRFTSDLKHRGSAEHISLLCLACPVHMAS